MTDEEVTYDYIKGHGWVPKLFERIEAHMADNVKVILILRPPRKGELYLAYSDSYSFRNPLKKLKRMAWSKRFDRLRPRHSKPHDGMIYAVVQRV